LGLSFNLTNLLLSLLIIGREKKSSTYVAEAGRLTVGEQLELSRKIPAGQPNNLVTFSVGSSHPEVKVSGSTKELHYSIEIGGDECILTRNYI
jgi:hypothetical protein